ncbi:SNF2 family N-terminal domain-containing protein [Xylariaceae sp. FL0255]|nr:SNF2 family N-terminal domain-containing protein [Xylariaceae sp. FL0255]
MDGIKVEPPSPKKIPADRAQNFESSETTSEPHSSLQPQSISVGASKPTESVENSLPHSKDDDPRLGFSKMNDKQPDTVPPARAVTPNTDQGGNDSTTSLTIVQQTNPDMSQQTRSCAPNELANATRSDSGTVIDNDEESLMVPMYHNQESSTTHTKYEDLSLISQKRQKEDEYQCSEGGYGSDDEYVLEEDPFGGADLMSIKKKDKNSKTRTIKPTSNQTRGPLPKTAREWFAKHSEEMLRSVSALTGVKRKRSQDTDTSNDQPLKKAKSTGPKEEKRGKEAMSAMFDYLRTSNPFEARIEQGDVPSTKPITAESKKVQFQQIMERLPQKLERNPNIDLKTLNLASRSFGLGNCEARDGKWLIKGMKSSLLNYQVVGVSWMLGRELALDGPSGGILADEMGMGKTLQTLACIVSNPPTDIDLQSYSKATLIVVPATAIPQWIDEIKKHTEKKGIDTVLQFKKSQKMPPKVYQDAGIVLTSYNEITAQFANCPKKGKVKDSEELDGDAPKNKKQDDWNNEDDASSKAPLFGIKFWRIVLDESHNIKNRSSRTSLACRELQGKHRWALSGTPVTNSTDEFYPYLDFIQSNKVKTWRDFQKKYGNLDDEVAHANFGDTIAEVMLRRTTSDRFLGVPLYEIPMCHPDVKRIPLSKEEGIIYSVVVSRYRDIINEALKKARMEGQGKVSLKDLKVYMVFLHRLRQGVGHPFLLEPVFKDVLKPEDLDKIKSELAGIENRQPVFEQIREWCAEKTETGENNFGSSQFGYELNLNEQLDLAAKAQQNVCRICYEEPHKPVTIKCEHVFCMECIEQHTKEELKKGGIIPKCPACGKRMNNWQYNNYSWDDQDDSRRKKSSRQWKKGADAFGVHPKLDWIDTEFLRLSDESSLPTVPSAKTTAVKDALIKWQKAAPDDKIIIYTEFKKTGAIIGRMLEAENIQFLYFYGCMTENAKESAKQAFTDRPEIRVLVSSLKCASVALNLTCANRVILVDLWWNIAIEMQAFCRVFRIGQQKETHFLRIVAEGTIDNKIEALQAKKIENIGRIMENGSSGSTLEPEEVLSMFGRLEKNAYGDLQLVSDDDHEYDADGDGE